MKYMCDDIRDRWAEYIYRELSESDQSLFVDHLQRCPSCRDDEALWRQMLVRFDSIAALDGTMDAPPELLYRVKRQIRFHEDWSIQIASRVRHWAAGAVAACFLTALSVAHWNGSVQVFNPFRFSVLTSIYDSNTLDLYREQGIIEEEANPKPVSLTDPPKEPVLNSDRENASS